jgi:hypothetical protein
MLPLLLASNTGVVAGMDAESIDNSRPVLLCNNRPVEVNKIVSFYRSALDRIGDVKTVYPSPLPPPRLKVHQGESRV